MRDGGGCDTAAAAIAPNGDKWVATLSGVNRLIGTSWVTYTTSDGLAKNDTISVAVDANGVVWAGSNGSGVSKLAGATPWTVYNTTNSVLTSSRFHVFDSSGSVNVFFYPGQLQYESINAQQVRAIENGAVVSRPMYTSGSVMLAEPRWFSDTDPITGKTTTVISLVGINSTIHMSQTGVGTVRMQIINTTYIEKSKPALGSTVTVEYRPDPANDYSVAWRNYFINSLRWTETATNTYQPPSTDTLVIKRYDILIKSI
jgi:hypothetical protein